MCNTDMDPLKYFPNHSFTDHICDATTNAAGTVSQILKASADVDGDDLVDFQFVVVGHTLRIEIIYVQQHSKVEI